MGIHHFGLDAVRVLYIPLKFKWWDEIAANRKPFEYRIFKNYWIQRLVGKEYDAICLTRGFPPKDDKSRHLWKKYNGYEIINDFVHEEFGSGKNKVFKIDVGEDF